MSQESSAAKWIVGCLAVGVVAVLVCAGVLIYLWTQGVRVAENVMQEVEQEMERQAEEMERQAELMEQASSWSPPQDWTAPAEGTDADAVLPPEVGEWQRSFQSTEASIPVVDIDREAWYGVYATGDHSLDVHVCSADADEKDALFRQAENALGASSGGHAMFSSDSGTARSLFYRSFGEGRTGWLVWTQGWLISVQAGDPEAPLTEFLSEYFATADAEVADEPADADAPTDDRGAGEQRDHDEPPA